MELEDLYDEKYKWVIEYLNHKPDERLKKIK